MTRTKAVLLASFFLAAALSAPAQAQNSTMPSNGGSDQEPSGPEIIQSPALSLDQFNGSGSLDKLVPGVIRISVLDAIDRGLKHNLGLLLSQEQTGSARAQHLRDLSALLPKVAFTSSERLQQINLAAFGIPVTVNGSNIVGPFAIFDARPTMTERLLDFSALNRLRSAAENEKAANFTVQDARELVVLVVGNQYLLILANAARLETVKAQLATAQAIFQQAQDMKKAGVVAGIDVLRAQVQMQEQQQRVLSAENQVEKQRMAFARTIGMPFVQQFELTDTVPYAPLPEVNIEEALARAYTRRPEYLAAQARTHAAEMQVTAAREERLPTLDVSGDYGVIGPTLGSARQTYSVAAGVHVPVFQGGRVKADVLQAQSNLNQLKSQLQDLHTRIEFEVRSAVLDVKTSTDQVMVARQSIDLAAEQLKQAQDRFASGVSGSLEVVQTQEAVATANETYIQALYLNNVAKLSLARALGVAEQQTRAFLGGK
ncbi:MAG TPA: TolC family protein [Candidatus Angelobacter sp.]|nr:TolC family protein [Candidatus Angelobacter sp.]